MANLPAGAISSKGIAATTANGLAFTFSIVSENFNLKIPTGQLMLLAMGLSTAFWYLVPETAFDKIIERAKDLEEANSRLQSGNDL